MNINFQKMRRICNMDIPQFKEYAQWNEKGRYFYKDNGAKILAIAHLDTVLPATHFEILKLPHKIEVYSPTLDDRLGAYVILEALNQSDIKYDILLTLDEEKGRSTAKNFILPEGKEYNWVFQFDRAGTDIVFYDYEYQSEWVQAFQKHGFKVGMGSYSDIDSLDIGVCGVNLGVGYEWQHTKDCFANLGDMNSMVKKFISFYNEFKDTKFEFTKPAYGSYNDYYGYEAGIRHYYDDDEVDAIDVIYNCSYCGATVTSELFKRYHTIYDDAEREDMCHECYTKAYPESRMFLQEYKSYLTKAEKKLAKKANKLINSKFKQ